MVVLHVKRGDESQFLLQAPGSTELEELTAQVTRVYNGRLKVHRLCTEIEELAEHGVFLPPNMQGLTDEQIEELKLKDEWGEKCVPSGGSVFTKDDIGRRNGHAPNEKMKQVLKKTVEEAKAMVSKKQVEAGVFVTMEMVKDALDQLRGAVMIVYPMGLPPYDPIRMEFENKEDLSGTQVWGSVGRPTGPAARLWCWGGMRMAFLLKPLPAAYHRQRLKSFRSRRHSCGGLPRSCEEQRSFLTMWGKMRKPKSLSRFSREGRVHPPGSRSSAVRSTSS